MVLDDTVEDMASNEAKITVNSGSGALDESPVVSLVVGGLGVGVVKVSDCDYERLASWFRGLRNDVLTNPVVHPEIRQTICQEHRRSSNAHGPDVQGSKSKNKSKVAQCNKRRFGWRKNVRSRIQMGLLVAG